MDFLYCGEANVLQENLDPFLALAEELRLKGLTGGGAETERDLDKEITQDKSAPQKKEKNGTFRAPLSNENFEDQPSKGSYDTTVAVIRNDKINVELQDLDEQIRSMITRSEISLPGKGKMASCNVCGKQGPYMAMPQHIEANHITGISHACDICGKVARSRSALSVHKSRDHKAIKA